MKLSNKFYQCRSEDEKVAWVAAYLKAGGTVSDVSLWLAGIDQPIRLFGQTKMALRAEGFAVAGTFRKVYDAAGQTHDVLMWSIKR